MTIISYIFAMLLLSGVNAKKRIIDPIEITYIEQEDPVEGKLIKASPFSIKEDATLAPEVTLTPDAILAPDAPKSNNIIVIAISALALVILLAIISVKCYKKRNASRNA